jgi:NDP-sugar pyrophosphorylase family protein
VARTFDESGKQALMTVFHNEGQWDTSNVEFADGRILAYNKKERTPRMKYIDYGLGAFTAKAFERVPMDRTFDLAELYQAILADGELAGMEIARRFYEIGSPEGLAETARFIASQEVEKA